METSTPSSTGETRVRIRKDLVERLNEILAQEHACIIRYSTHAAVLKGPYRDAVSARLLEIADDETRHARELRERICALGGTPTMRIKEEDLVAAESLADILDTNIREERTAIDHYAGLFATLDPNDAILHETIEDILRDEQEHLEELLRLRSTS